MQRNIIDNLLLMLAWSSVFGGSTPNSSGLFTVVLSSHNYKPSKQLYSLRFARNFSFNALARADFAGSTVFVNPPNASQSGQYSFCGGRDFTPNLSGANQAALQSLFRQKCTTKGLLPFTDNLNLFYLAARVEIVCPNSPATPDAQHGG
jgi:hypothetical protein